MNPYPTLAELSLIARSLPAYAVNGRTGDARVAVYVYRGHAWIETNGDPTGIEDADAGALADECGVTLDEVEQARAASVAIAAREAGIAWADREAEALEGAPVGAWLPGALDARPLVQDLESTEDFDPAEVCNAAAAARWADLVGMAEAEEHFAGDAQARA